LVCFDIPQAPIRSYDTPPELFPFGDLAVNGTHLGWVDRAPELGGVDFPVARVSPLERDSICEIAPSIAEAFVREMSLWLENRDPEHAQAIARVRAAAQAMGIELIPNASRLMYGADGKGMPVLVTVPEGYRFVPTADNIGVLAPAEAFQLKEEVDLIATAKWPARNVSRLAADVVDRFPATALFHCKILWWAAEPSELWADTMRRSYLALDRPSLAHNVESMLSL
jgi:hypothetical protein